MSLYSFESFSWGFYVVSLILLIIYWVFYLTLKPEVYYKKATFFYLIILILLVGLRPIGPNGFPDTKMYSDWFMYAKDNYFPERWKDIGFDFYYVILARLFNLKAFFFITTLLGISLVLKVSLQIDNKFYYWFIPLFFFTVFSFRMMGMIIRNGLALLFFYIAILETVNGKRKAFFLLLAILFHKSFVIPVSIYLLVLGVNPRLRYVVLIWFLSIPFLSAVGHKWLEFLVGLGIDRRANFYLLNDSNGISYYQKQLALQWQPFLYSIFVMGYGIYFVLNTFKHSILYRNIVCTFILTNAFWITVMDGYATFRFFLLSSALTPLIVAYPIISSFKWQKSEIKKMLIILTVLLLITDIFFVRRWL